MPRSAPADTRAWGCGGRGCCTLQRSHKMSGDCCCAAAAVLSWGELLLLCCCCCAELLLCCCTTLLLLLCCTAAALALGSGSCLQAPTVIFGGQPLQWAIGPLSCAPSFPDDRVSPRKWRTLYLLTAFPKSVFYSLLTPSLCIYMQLPLFYLTWSGWVCSCSPQGYWWLQHAMRSLIHLLVFRTQPTAPRRKIENRSYVRKEQFASTLAIKG